MDFSRLFGREDVSSKDVAKERLRLVLVHDRADCSPEFLELIKTDIIGIISGYMEIDEEGLEIKLTRMPRDKVSTVPALVANIPIKKVKHMGKR
jgi:cell division topological specificity factor